jgi:hypothetical protein
VSLSWPEDRNPVWTVGILCFLRERGGYSDEETAKKLRFNSVEEMHTQSKSWNLPDGLVGEEADSGKSRVHEKSARPLRGCGLANELPSAGDATELFKERLEALLKSAELLLDRCVDESLCRK